MSGKPRPKAGYVFVRLESQLRADQGGILLPEKVRERPGKVGIVIDYTPYPNALYRIFRRGRLETGNWSHLNAQFEGLTGKRVLCDAGQIVSFSGQHKDEIFVVRLEHIALIMDPALRAEQSDIHFNGVPRCRWCPSGGEDNMILDNLGYCPKCNLNAEGQHRRFRDSGPVSDDLSYHMNRKVVDAIDHSKLSKKIMTFGKGACKRGAKAAARRR